MDAIGKGRIRAFAAGLAVGLAMLGSAASAEAGIYTVRQCDAAGANLSPTAPDATVESNASAYSVKDVCAGADAALKVSDAGPARSGHYGLWRLDAPAGARIIAASLGAQLGRDQGHHPLVYAADAGGGVAERIVDETAGWDPVEWNTGSADGAASIAARLRCQPASGDVCDESGQAQAWIRNVRLTVNDVSAPDLTLDGALLDGGWRSGQQTLDVSIADQGGGVRRVEVDVNDARVAGQLFGCETIEGSNDVARMQPCATSRERSFQLDTAAAPFREGLNQVTVCAEDFGPADANRTCASETVRTDNQAPAAPENLMVAGGDGWHRVNDFDVSWENPQDDGAPIDGVRYRLETPGGAIVEEGTVDQRADLEALADRHVPVPGPFILRIWLIDGAGNQSESNSATVGLRFDDVAPGVPTAAALAGWLSRDELAAPYVQSWAAPDSVPVSGIGGYAFGVDRSASTNPCETNADPDPTACVGSEVTNGPDDLAETITDLPEGNSYVHVAAVSGSGVRSDSVAHVELHVDLTDPETELLGAPAGWTNQPVTLVARATDALSGMQAVAGDDGRPVTTIEVDGGAPTSDSGDQAGRIVSEEGDHLVRYWARDLAGNESSPASAHVRIDGTAPTVAFANAQDPADPELVRAPISDALSGVDGGEISYRAQGESTWHPLATDLRGGELRARLPSGQLPDGTYELRAEATDRAANRATSTERQDGSAMTLRVPLKIETELRADLGPGGKRLTIGYDRASSVSGRLVDPNGDAIAGQELRVEETFADGSLDAARTRTVTTGPDGEFDLGLAPGPTREVTVSFEGSRRYADADSDDLHLHVRGKAGMEVSSKRVAVRRRFRFYGRVAHLGARLPAGGKLVELQVARPEGWDTVRQAFRTRADGRWRFPFRFGDYYAEPTRFRFRLKVTREGGFPYEPVTTRPRVVTVVPRR